MGSGQQAPAGSRPVAPTAPSPERRAQGGGHGGRRWFKIGRRVVAGGLLAGGIYAATSHSGDLHTAIDRLGHLRWPWLLLAVWAECSSMVVFARLQRWLLRAGGVRVRLRDMVEITLAGNALSVSIPGGAAWSAAWIWGQLRRRRVDRVLAAWVVLVAGALASYALFLLVVVGAEIPGSHGPVADLRWVTRSLMAVGVLLVAGLFALARSPRLQRWWRRFHHQWRAAGGRRERAAGALARFGERLRVVQPSPRAWLEALGLALANWVADLVALICCILAIGASVPWWGIVISYALTQISASIPITPGGLAVVEASLTALLAAYGMPAATAITVVLLYRLISFWFLVPVGWASWGWLEWRGRRRRAYPGRRHPWAFHHHDGDGTTDDPGAPWGAGRILAPDTCADCDQDRAEPVPAGRRRD
jgi:uncharacterized protein (TIRG00374 family)